MSMGIKNGDNRILSDRLDLPRNHLARPGAAARIKYHHACTGKHDHRIIAKAMIGLVRQVKWAIADINSICETGQWIIFTRSSWFTGKPAECLHDQQGPEDHCYYIICIFHD